jgi:type IV secretion system protein VirD4
MKKFLIAGIIVTIAGISITGYVVYDLWQAITTLTQQTRDAGWWEQLNVKTPIQFATTCYLNDTCKHEFATRLPSYQNVWKHLWLIGLSVFSVGGITILATLPQKPKPYSAKFAKLSDIRQFIVSHKYNYLIPLVILQRQMIGLIHDTKTVKRLQHVLVTAPSQSGKSVHAKSVLTAFHGSSVTVDMKGELYRDTAGYRSTFSSIVVLNPRGIGYQYDPFADIGTDIESLRAAAEILVIDPNDRDPIFAQRALSAVTAALRGAYLEDEPSIPYLHRVVQMGPQKFVEHLIRHNDRIICEQITTFLGTSPESFSVESYDDSRGFIASAWGTLVTRLEPFFTDGVRKMMGGSDFTAQDFLKYNMSIYLMWPEELSQSALRPLSLIIHALITGLCREADSSSDSNLRTLLLLDEAAQYPIPSLPNYMSTMLGRGISALIYVQDNQQLITNYGHDQASTITANCKCQLFFSPTYTTAKYLSEQLGYKTIENQNYSQHTGDRNSSSVSTNQMRRELMTADELTRLPDDEAILLIRGQYPIRGKRIMWYKNKKLKQRIDLLAPKIETIITNDESNDDSSDDDHPQQYTDPDDNT